jgi:hypothetical protein
MAVRLSALHVGHHLLPGRFLELISVKGTVSTRAIVRLERSGQLKKKTNDLIKNQTRDLLASCIVLQQTMQLHAP